MEIKGILFDKDGTLIDFFKVWEPAIKPVLERLLAQLGLEFDREEFLKQLQELKKEAYQDGEHIRESVRAIVSTYRYQ